MTLKEELERRKAIATLWKRAELGFLLDSTQKSMLGAFKQSEERKFILLCSRRLGKTYLLIVTALEVMLKKKSKVIYITDSFKAAKEIVQPTMTKVLQSCPDAIKPKFKTQDTKYVFPNGSEMLLVGSDKNPDNCRGQEADLVLIDEAGFVNKLHYLISSVLTPALLMTNGRIFMATTPSKDEDHDFLQYLAQGEANGSVVKKTIYDNPRISEKMIQEFMAEAGGEDSEAWQREYLVKVIRNKDTTVLPEFDESAVDDIVSSTYNFHPFYDKYSGMDLGFTDNTGLVMGFYDFTSGKVVIQKELLIQKLNTNQIAEQIKQAEQSIWPGNPYRRMADCNNPQFIFDLSELHGLTFFPDPRYGTKEQRINKLRLMIQNRELIIDPSCVNLITQMKYCKWKNADRMTFFRSEQYGHFDLVDALIILVNNIDRNRNPIPVNHNIQVQANIPTVKEKRSVECFVPKSVSRIRRPNLWN